jgi:beta-mannosidase
LVTLSAKSLAKNIFLSAEGFDGQFSENYFDMIPGEKVTVTIPKSKTINQFREAFSILHL